MKGNVLTRGLTSGATYNASVQDYYDNLRKQYEKAKRQQAEYEKRRREYEKELKDSEEKKAKLQRERDEYLEKLKKDTLPEEREKAAVRAQEKWSNGETPDQRDQDLFEISDYKKALPNGDDQQWYEKAWRKVKDFFLSSDAITATGWKMNDIQASQFSGNLAKSREDQQLLDMAEAYYKGDKNPNNYYAIQELNKRKPGILNTAAVYANKALDWIGNNSVTGTTGAFLGTDELDKVRTGINFDENTTSQEALQNIAALRNSYKAFDEESYAAYLENHNKAKYYENMLNSEYKRKLNIAEGRAADENGVTDGSIDFFNFSKLAYQLPGIIAGSISSPSQLLSSFATGAATAAGVAATATAAGAAIVGTGGLAAPLVLGGLTALGAGATFGLNQAQGSHENSAEVDEAYVQKVKYALDQHPGAAADFYKEGRSLLGKGATDEEIIVAKLANRIPSSNKIVDKAFDDAAIGSQRQYDRDMVATTGDSTIDTALQITPIKFFSSMAKSAIKGNQRAARIARAANKVKEKFSKLDAGDGGVLRKAFGKWGALVSGEGAAAGAVAGTVLDNILGRIPKVNTLIESMAHFDIAKIKRFGPKTSNWINYGESILGRGLKSAVSEGVEEGKQYYNQQRAIQEFQEGLKNGNLSYDTQTILGDVLDDFQAGNFAAAGLVQAMTGIHMLDIMHYTDSNIINVAEAIKNIKSGMVGGHGQTAIMTAATGLPQAAGTSGVIDDMEQAIRALEDGKLTAQKQFAQDQILSRTDSKYIASAIDYLKNSNSIKLTDKELEDLQARAVEVKGVSDSKYTKKLAKDLGIAKEDYHKFVADYMYHKDMLAAERENLQGAGRDLDAKANEIKAASENIVNPSDAIFEQWTKNDKENDKRRFETQRSEQIEKLQRHIKALNDKLEKEALTGVQKKNVEDQISSAQESLKEVEESKFDDSKSISYSQARFDRINTIARISGVVKQLRFLDTILSAIGEDNVSGKEYVQKQIEATKKLLNSYLTGNMLNGKQLTADNLDQIDEWSQKIATQIERADQDNEYLTGASAELTGQINSLAQAYQEHSNAILNYNIAASLFNDFVGYDTVDGEVVEEGTEGAEHVKGNAKQHLEGIAAAQDDDAKLEQAFQQGFANYGFSGVYKDESPLVREEEREEEEAKPGTTERRRRIKDLAQKIREFASEAKHYVSGKWKSFGHKDVFVPDDSGDSSELDSSEDELNKAYIYNEVVEDYKNADDVEKWLDSNTIKDSAGIIQRNSHWLIGSYLAPFVPIDIIKSKDFTLGYSEATERSLNVYYKGVRIGTVTPVVDANKSNGDLENKISFQAEGFDVNKLSDVDYLESLIKPEPADSSDGVEGGADAATANEITEQQETKIQVLKDLTEKMNNKFDVTLRTASHYFEWVDTPEGRKLKLWHRLHDEIGSNFKEDVQNKKNWTQLIKILYSVVYHQGYSKDTPEGTKDIQALLNRLENFYASDNIKIDEEKQQTVQMNQRLLDNIEGYVLYLKQEGDNISDADLYECIKGIAEEIAPDTSTGSNAKHKILDRGTATDTMCRTIFGQPFPSPQKALEYCKTLKMVNSYGVEVFVKDYFTEEGFEQAIQHLWNTKKVYVEELGYVLWTSPFTIYTEDFKNKEGGNINIAGEVDMLAIDQEGNTIIIDFKTSKNPFFVNGEESPNFRTPSPNQTKSAKEQYTLQQSAYVQMLNETTRKETGMVGGFNCSEARLLPIRLIGSDQVNKVAIEFSKDQQLSLQVIPFEEIGNNVIFDKETYRSKLAQLSALYAKVQYLATHLSIYYRSPKERDLMLNDVIRNIMESLDSIQLCLQEVTSTDLDLYAQKVTNAIASMEGSYFGNKQTIDRICNEYNNGELSLNEEEKARDYNNLDWNSPLNDNDIDKLGGFEAIGVKDRKEYDEKVDELAHVACEAAFQATATAKLTAVQYKTRRGNDKIAVYASITYKDVTYPPIRIYLSKTNGEKFANDVLAGNTVGGNIQTTVGLLSRCSDGTQHAIADSRQLVEAINGTEENPYENFVVSRESNDSVAVVTYNKSTGSLSTVSTMRDTVVSLPKTLKKSSANGHIVINVIPEVSGSGKRIPIVCNTPKINEYVGKDESKHRSQSLLDFLVNVVLAGINNSTEYNPLKEHVKITDDEELPITYEQLLNFFFEPYDSSKGTFVQRPQYAILRPERGSQSWSIKIGDFSTSSENRARIINLDDTAALRKAISQLSIWVSMDMASVKWSNDARFRELVKSLSELEDGERLYLGDTGIYFDKSDANGTYLGFLAKNGLLTTPFNGFSHPLISIQSCQKEATETPPAVREGDPELGGEGNELGSRPQKGAESEKHDDEYEEEYAEYVELYRDDDEDSSQPNSRAPEEDPLDAFYKKSKEVAKGLDDQFEPKFHKIQKGHSRLDETAARQYIERVLGKQFADDNYEVVDEICSAIVGGLSAGTIIAGQVTANMMKLSRYAQNGTEYHEAFHWIFELIIDPRESDKIRNIVRKKYGITDEREIAEWLADTYMYYVRDVYVPKGTLLQKAFAKIRQWVTTFKRIFTGEYQIYKVFNDINSGKFVNRPINNEAVLRFQEKFKELNQTTPTEGFVKDGIQYKYQQGSIDHEQNIKQIAFFALHAAAVSPAVSYVTNGTINVNVKSVLDRNPVKRVMMLDHYDGQKFIKGIDTEKILKDRQNPKNRGAYHAMDNALALRELLDDEHIEKTAEYVNAYIDKLIGVKGKDLSVEGQDDGSAEATMDGSYAKVEDGEVSFAGSPKEHIIPDHQISRMSKTSSRIKLFFATIPNYVPNEFGKLGYYNLREIYQTIQNRYYWVMSPAELWKALENDSKDNRMVQSLYEQIVAIKKLVNEGNKKERENAIGLLNEIYRSIKSTKQSHEVIKTRRDPDTKWLTYMSTNIMVQNNSYAISREFTETVLGGFNKFFEPVSIKDPKTKEETRAVKLRTNIQDGRTGEVHKQSYWVEVYNDFFGSDYKTFTEIRKERDEYSGKTIEKKINRVVPSLYDVVITYGMTNQQPLYVKKGDQYIEYPVESNAKYIKSKFVDALSAVGVDITDEQLDDILETQFGGTGIRQLQQFLLEEFTLPARGNLHKAGAKVTIWKAVDEMYTQILSEMGNGNGVISVRLDVDRYGHPIVVNGTDVFRRQKLQTVLSILIATAQQKKYEVSARGVDGKLSYAMSDDNTVTAMCDVIFNKTDDPQCTKIRQMITNDPFNISAPASQFGRIPIGSYILSKIAEDDDASRNKNIDYEVVNDAGIETGNNENSSTNSDKRGADTIMATITKLCQNMIVLAPFADKSTGLAVRLHGVRIPGIDYDAMTYSFRENDQKEELEDEFKRYMRSITVDETGRVMLHNKNNSLDRVIAGYVLAEYFQAKKAIQDYKAISNNPAKDSNEETAKNICKKLMFMSQFSGDYVQNEKGEWVFNPFSIEKGSTKTDLQAAEEMIKQFEDIVTDEDSLLQFVNRQINGLMQHELDRLKAYDIIKKRQPNKTDENPRTTNQLLDRNILQRIYSAIHNNYEDNNGNVNKKLANEHAIFIFMYDIVGKAIISKQESERLFTGQSDLYNIKRDGETKIITVPYQDQAKRIGSFASTGSVGVMEDENYTCAEIPDDFQSIKDQVKRSVFMNEITHAINSGAINMADHPGFDFRYATSEDLKNLIPSEYWPIVDKKIEDILKGFPEEKEGEKNNNVTDGVSFISAEFAKKLLKAQGAWNYRIARAFEILNSNDKNDIEQILNSWETFSRVFTQVIGTQKYTAVGFRTEVVNGQNKVVQYVNKTALFPVFACMCNDKMDAIRKQMDAQKVDMLMFESVVKVGAHGNSSFTVDSSGNVTGNFNTYSQKSFFLRKQLNTDPNEKEKMKIGIQTVKVALSAAIGEKELDWRGEKVDGNVIIDQIMDDITTLTEKRSEKLMGKLETPSDVANYVARFLRGNNVPESTIDAFLQGIPAEALGIQKHIDTLSAKRIQEDVVRIDSPGSAFIQRCVYGVEGPAKFGSLELNDGEELKVVNEDGSMDCVVSIDYFVEYRNGIPYFKLTPGRKKKALMIYDPSLGKKRPMSFEEIRKWLKDTGVIGKNAKSSILSYRIPTQAVASINALKCVDVIPVVRDTVVLPKLFTTITGADFDIDKLFISTVWYTMEEQEDGSYKPRQIQDGDTEEGCANTVVNDYIEILCATAKKHPEIFYRSVDDDTKLADDVIADIKKWYPPTEQDKLANASGILQSMPSMQAKVHDEFLAGRQGIGPFALALVNHVLTRIYGVSFKGEGIYLRHKSLSKDEDDDGKSIMGWLSAMINKHVDVAKNPDITYLNVNDSTFNVVALLLRLGYGRRTFMFTCQQIMRDYAFAINQETAVCKYTKNENNYNDPREQAYQKIRSAYKLDKIEKNVTSKCSQEDIYRAACTEIFDRNWESKKSLCEYILSHNGEVPEGVTIKIGKENFKLTKELFQYLNLQLFNYLSDSMAKPLTKLQQATVIDNERCVTSMIQSSFYEQIVNDVKQDKTFSNVDRLFKKSYIDTKIQKVLEGTNAIYNGCSSMDKDVVVTIAKAIDPNILQYGKKRMNTFLSIIRDGMVAYYGAQFFDEYCKNNNIDRSVLFKVGSKSIVRRLAKIQASARSNRGNFKRLRNNLLIRGLSIDSIIGEEYIEDEENKSYNDHRFKDYEFLRFKYAGQSDDSVLTDVQESWEQLLNDPSEEIREFARDLIVYAFYTSGEMSGTTKLFKYVPVSWRVDSGYGQHFENIKNNKDQQYIDIDDIVDKLCRNLWYRDKFVRTIGRSTLLKFEGSDILKSNTRTVSFGSEDIGEGEIEAVPDPILQPVIAGIQVVDENKVRAIFPGDKDNCPKYIKCVDDHHNQLTSTDDSAATWTLYKLVGFNTYIDSQQKSWQYPVYVQTSALGEKYYRNNIFEYGETLEPTKNIDAYEVTKKFLSKLGSRVETKDDVANALENVITILNVVNLGVKGAIGEDATVATAARESVNILVTEDQTTGRFKTTFKPLRMADEFLEQRRKRIENQQKKSCNR